MTEIEKYKKNLASIGQESPMQVSLQEANESGYDKVIWIHAQYTPQEPGIELIAKSLGIDKSKICVPDARTAQELLTTQQIPESTKQRPGRRHQAIAGLYGGKDFIDGC